MTDKPSRSKSALIFGGTALWGVFLVGCVMVQRTVVMPPSIPGATYVGDSKCSQCHEDVTSKFHDATHAKLFADGVKGEAIGCESCHNPHGSMNAKMLKARNANLCLQCHFQQQTAPGVILIGGRDHASFLSRGTCWSAGCHEAVHGSHVSSSLRF
jgi:predicted CXXCH cytochrome family protein